MILYVAADEQMHVDRPQRRTEGTASSGLSGSGNQPRWSEQTSNRDGRNSSGHGAWRNCRWLASLSRGL